MVTELEKQKPAIAELCRQYNVSKLEVIGSATRADFHETSSDYDFILKMPVGEPGVAKRFFAFADALESLLGRQVDLVFEERMKPRFRLAIDEIREVVFEQGSRTVAA